MKGSEVRRDHQTKKHTNWTGKDKQNHTLKDKRCSRKVVKGGKQNWKWIQEGKVEDLKKNISGP